MEKCLSIGLLAKAAGVSIETIRYYERRGLIQQPVKPAAGHRTYTGEHLERVLFIKRAQELGFSLDEIQSLLALGEMHCDEIEKIANRKLNDVRTRIKDLRRLEKVLNTLTLRCSENPDQAPCPIVESLLPKEE